MKGMKKTKIYPKDGLRPHSWYLVEVATDQHNPVFRALMYTGFLQSNKPDGYSGIVQNGTSAPIRIESTYYLKVIRLVASEDDFRMDAVTKAMPDDPEPDEIASVVPILYGGDDNLVIGISRSEFLRVNCENGTANEFETRLQQLSADTGMAIVD